MIHALMLLVCGVVLALAFPGSGRDGVTELRYYDFDEGYSFNMAEISLKKDPSDRYRFGYGLVLTGGQDAQKNHAIGIFRDKDDIFPFRNTPKVDLQEAYLSYKVPVGSGLTLKGGKFATLIGYEVLESPNNLKTHERSCSTRRRSRTPAASCRTRSPTGSP